MLRLHLNKNKTRNKTKEKSVTVPPLECNLPWLLTSFCLVNMEFSVILRGASSIHATHTLLSIKFSLDSLCHEARFCLNIQNHRLDFFLLWPVSSKAGFLYQQTHHEHKAVSQLVGFSYSRGKPLFWEFQRLLQLTTMGKTQGGKMPYQRRVTKFQIRSNESEKSHFCFWLACKCK